jgi:protein-disulfide isomerase
MRPIAILLIGLCLAAGLAGCNKSSAGGGAPSTGEMSLGDPNAKVTVVEYASLGCPICANFNNTIFPAFKAKYIDTGKVRYTLREFLAGDQPVAAAGFLLAHCAPKDKYFQVVDAVWRQEAPLLETDRSAEKRDALVKIAESSGLTEAQFDTCVTDDAALKALNDRTESYAKNDNIRGTPTFVVNGVQVDKAQPTLDDLDKAIAAAQAAAK